jgi:hypothetical protein
VFKLQIEPWDQVKSIEISTIYATIRLREEGDYVEYEHSEYGNWEYVEYKFKIKKRQNYKEYVKMLAEVDVEPVDLRNLVGVMAFFREVYQHVVSLYRRGSAANLTFRWQDREVQVEFVLYASKSEKDSEIQSIIRASYGDEHLAFLHQEVTEDVEEDLKKHTEDAVGLYMLFKEYILPQQEPGKT